MHGHPLAVVLLDYYNFFDSFEPGFNGDMPKAVGVDHDLTDMFTDINKKHNDIYKLAIHTVKP